MTAKEKFEEQLRYCDLMDEWNSVGRCGRVAKFMEDYGEIVVFVHESEKDKYTEIHYPTFNELRKNDKFVRRVADEHFGCYDKDLLTCDDDEFQFKIKLASWLRGRPVECPLFPVDVYFAADGMETGYNDFDDDPVGIMDTTQNHSPALVAQINDKSPRHLDGTPWHKCNSYEELEEYFGRRALYNDPKHPKWWLVGRFTDGVLWMNNEDGVCYLDSSEAADIYYARRF